MALKGPGLRRLTASPLTSPQPRAGVTAGPRRGSWQRCCGSAPASPTCAPRTAPRSAPRRRRAASGSKSPVPPAEGGRAARPPLPLVHRCWRESPRKQPDDAALPGENNCLVCFNSQQPCLMAPFPLTSREGRRRARRRATSSLKASCKLPHFERVTSETCV